MVSKKKVVKEVEPEKVEQDDAAATQPVVDELEAVKADDSELAIPVGWRSQSFDFKTIKNINQMDYVAKAVAASGMFSSVSRQSTAIVQIMAGQEIGVTPFQALSSIHIIKGRATMSANLMAGKVKESSKYDYKVDTLTKEKCVISFFEIVHGKKELLGVNEFTMDDAKSADLVKSDSGWTKYPKNMLFARALSSGVRFYCPDVFNGNSVYTPDELGRAVDQDGEILEGTPEPPAAPAPTADVSAPVDTTIEGELIDSPDYTDDEAAQVADEPFTPMTEQEVEAFKKDVGARPVDNKIDIRHPNLLRKAFQTKGYSDQTVKAEIIHSLLEKKAPETWDEYDEAINFVLLDIPYNTQTELGI